MRLLFLTSLGLCLILQNNFLLYFIIRELFVLAKNLQFIFARLAVSDIPLCNSRELFAAIIFLVIGGGIFLICYYNLTKKISEICKVFYELLDFAILGYIYLPYALIASLYLSLLVVLTEAICANLFLSMPYSGHLASTLIPCEINPDLSSSVMLPTLAEPLVESSSYLEALWKNTYNIVGKVGGYCWEHKYPILACSFTGAIVFLIGTEIISHSNTTNFVDNISQEIMPSVMDSISTAMGTTGVVTGIETAMGTTGVVTGIATVSVMALTKTTASATVVAPIVTTSVAAAVATVVPVAAVVATVAPIAAVAPVAVEVTTTSVAAVVDVELVRTIMEYFNTWSDIASVQCRIITQAIYYLKSLNNPIITQNGFDFLQNFLSSFAHDPNLTPRALKRLHELAFLICKIHTREFG